MRENSYDNELTIKELILKFQEIVKELKSKWVFLLLFSIPFLVYYVYDHYSHVPEYSAKYTFVVEGQGGGSSGIAGILGSFGIGRSSKVNPYKIIEVGKSDLIFNKIAFKDKDSNLLVNRIIDVYELRDKWSESNKDFEDFSFKSSKLKSRIEHSAMKRLKTRLWGNKKLEIDGLAKFDLNEEMGIYNLEVTTISEELSLDIANYLFEDIKHFFDDEIFENQKKSVSVLKSKLDSLESLVTTKSYTLNSLKDQSHGIFRNENKTGMSVLANEIQALNMVRAEVLKNYELADVQLRDVKPLFMKLDTPYLPLTPSRSSLIRSIIMAFVISMFIGTIIILIRKFINDALK